jgi:tetratricopeptide (TPR) repeat protein
MYYYLKRILEDAPSDKLRDPRRAVEIAREAIQMSPKNWTATDALGIALFRIGDWQASIDAFEKSIALVGMDPLPQYIDPKRWLYIAMAEWRLGNKDKAREWYDRAVQWMEKSKPINEELRRFRDEAAELLGIKEPTQPIPPTTDD